MKTCIIFKILINLMGEIGPRTIVDIRYLLFKIPRSIYIYDHDEFHINDIIMEWIQ